MNLFKFKISRVWHNAEDTEMFCVCRFKLTAFLNFIAMSVKQKKKFPKWRSTMKNTEYARYCKSQMSLRRMKQTRGSKTKTEN